jgi:D-alanyl-D-alanine carboxypeptidase/D-alanyl-D-alanine-endopeptidase (penicillin-binding protein 4)
MGGRSSAASLPLPPAALLVLALASTGGCAPLDAVSTASARQVAPAQASTQVTSGRTSSPPPAAAGATFPDRGTPVVRPGLDAGARATGDAGVTPPVPARRQTLRQLRNDILAATRRPGVTRGSWGIVVHSLDRDVRLFALNADHLLIPASVAKIVSTASAVDAVGWNHTFETTLRGTGPVENGALRGDLLVVGSGDPSIGGKGGADFTAWIQALTALGISRIEGRIVGDDDALEEPRPALAWAWDDLGYSSGALFGALNYGENRMPVLVIPGALPGEPATLTVGTDATQRPLINRVTTGDSGSAALVWAEQRPQETGLSIAGSLPAGSPPVRLVVSAGNPTAWFAGALRHALVAAGIQVVGPAVDIDEAAPRPDRSAAALLYTFQSPPLSEIVQPMLKDSINLYAEAVMRLNARPGVFPTNDAALAGLQQRFAAWGVADEAQHQIDGSGLSRRNLIAPDVVLAVLRRMHDPSGASPFMTALPVAGVDGSLAGRMRGTAAAGNLRAKTGTMSTVRALAGYVTTASGERLAFVILLNNFEGTAAQATDAVDAIAIRLATFSRR